MTDAADDFDALFEEVAAQRASAPAPAPAPAPEPAAGGDSGDDDDLEALFDQVASGSTPASAPPVAAPVAAAATSASVATGHEGADDPDGQMMYARLGSIVRIMGGRSLSPFVGNVDGVRLLSAGAEPAEQFLRSLA